MPIQLHHFAKQYPHTGRMRKRVRVLRGPKPAKTLELWYKTELLKIVRLMSTAVEHDVLPLVRQLAPQWQKTGDSMMAADGYSVDLSDKIDQVSKQFGGIRQTAQRLAALAAQRAKENTDAQLVDSIKKSVSIDVTGALTDQGIANAVERAVVANVELISSIPEQYFGKVRSAVFNGVGDGLRWEDIAEKIQEVTDATESRAKLIARDQVSKMNGSFNQVRQEDLGIEKYQWAGAMDERERESHAANEGKIFRWDDPPAETGHPGEDINCRCTALPVFDLDKEEKNLGLSDE